VTIQAQLGIVRQELFRVPDYCDWTAAQIRILLFIIGLRGAKRLVTRHNKQSAPYREALGLEETDDDRQKWHGNAKREMHMRWALGRWDVISMVLWRFFCAKDTPPNGPREVLPPSMRATL
jgi:hypothetical protein